MTVTGTVEVGVSALVWKTETRRQFLVGLRTGSHGADEWWLPGGKPDPGETPASAVIREIREETNLRLDRAVDKLNTWTYDRWPEFDRHFVCVYYDAVALNPDQLQVMEPDKCREWRWVDWIGVPEPYHPSIDEILSNYYD